MRYTKHALARMKELGLSKAEVLKTLIGYDTCMPAHRGCVNLWKGLDEYRLRITFEPMSRVVVTVWKEIQ